MVNQALDVYSFLGQFSWSSLVSLWVHLDLVC